MNRAGLIARAQQLRSEMRRNDLMLQATVVQRRTKCGSAGCRCARGEYHTAWSLTYKEKGKTRTVRIDEDIRAEVIEWAENWKRFRRLLKSHNAALIEAVRQPGKGQSRKRKKS
jgi:hypothetical protein